MYNIKLNNYHEKPKSSNIQTPPAVSQFIYELLKGKFIKEWRNQITDPCCGQGNLLKPWKEAGFNTYGNDIDINYLEQGLAQGACDFLKKEPVPILPPHLVLCNPPFNGYGHKLGSEVWLDKIIELFGKEIPIVLFAPVGFCANLTLNNKRHEKFENGTYPPISSRITLPKNIFEGVIFHSEILIFNLQGLKSHYFLPTWTT